MRKTISKSNLLNKKNRKIQTKLKVKLFNKSQKIN